jgi:hypothetical protein
VNPRDIYYIYDDPIPFKNDLKLYPVSMRDYLQFFTFASCLMLEKNSIQNNPTLAIKAISMSYLEYLDFVSVDDKYNEDNPSPLQFFFALLRLCMRLPEGTKFDWRHKKDDDKPVFIIDGNVYDSGDFDLFRDIVSEQNMLELPNENIQKNVRDSLEEARRYKAKLNGQKMAGLEDQILALSLESSWELDRIYDMTIRKFIKALKRADHVLHQKIYLSASLSGMVEFKDKSFIKSWLADIDERDDLSGSMDVDKLQNKVNMNEAKENALKKNSR